MLRRLGKRATFADVIRTAYYLGFDISSEEADNVLLTEREGACVTPVHLDCLIAWLNDEMEVREIIAPIED